MLASAADGVRARDEKKYWTSLPADTGAEGRLAAAKAWATPAFIPAWTAAVMASGDNAAIELPLSPLGSLFKLVPSSEPDGRDISRKRWAKLFLVFLANAKHSDAKHDRSCRTTHHC